MPQCMEKYKNNFEIEFSKIMQANPQWKKFQKEHIKKLYTSGLLISLFAFCCGFLPYKNETNYDITFHFIMAIVLFVISILINLMIENNALQEEIKKDLLSKLAKVFGKNIEFGCGKISYSEYNDSRLFNKPIRYDSIDDSFSGIYNDTPFIITESSLTYLKTSHGKTQETQLFRGIAMFLKMQKKIKSRVLIYSKSKFNKPPKGFEKVEFEYEKFNKRYDVYVEKNKEIVDGQIEARYLFNTAFMDRFMQLQTSFKVNKMQCSIFGDSMLILLSMNRDLFELYPLFKQIDDINQYKTLFDEFASVLSFIDVLNLSSKTGL